MVINGNNVDMLIVCQGNMAAPSNYLIKLAKIFKLFINYWLTDIRRVICQKIKYTRG
jgi:hypothetical protein